MKLLGVLVLMGFRRVLPQEQSFWQAKVIADSEWIRTRIENKTLWRVMDVWLWGSKKSWWEGGWILYICWPLKSRIRLCYNSGLNFFDVLTLGLIGNHTSMWLSQDHRWPFERGMTWMFVWLDMAAFSQNDLKQSWGQIFQFWDLDPIVLISRGTLLEQIFTTAFRSK